MLGIPPSVRIFVCKDPVDMRCGRYRLAAKVKEELSGNPLSGHLFLFFNRQRTSVKILYYDVSGYALWYKVLEGGRYTVPTKKSELSSLELSCILEGVNIDKLQRKRHFRLRNECNVS